MDDLKYLSLFKESFPIAYTHISSPSMKSFLNTRDYKELPHVILHGNSPWLNQQYIDLFLNQVVRSNKSELIKHHCTEEVTYNRVKVSVEYLSFDEGFEFDVDSLINNDRYIICGFVKSVIGRKCLRSGEKHIIVLHNIDRIHAKSLAMLSSLLNCHNALFILSCASTSSINTKLKSHCALINAHVINFASFARLFIQNHRSDIGDPSDWIEKSNHDIVSLCVLLELSSLDEYNDYLHLFLSSALKQLVALASRQTSSSLKHHPYLIIKQMVTTLMKSSAPFQLISSQIIKIVSEEYPMARIIDVVELCAETDHMLVNTSRHIFTLERFFLKLTERIHGLKLIRSCHF
jgi:hypothetical protein